VTGVEDLPAWIVVVAALTPVFAAAGALVGIRLTRKGTVEQDKRWHREESMRMLRWATELALSEQTRRAATGWQLIEALQDAQMLQEEDVVFLDAVTAADLAGTLDTMGTTAQVEVAAASKEEGEP
jgi:hypothetical protein